MSRSASGKFVIVQQVRLKSAAGFPKPVRFRGPKEALGLKAVPTLDSVFARYVVVRPRRRREGNDA